MKKLSAIIICAAMLFSLALSVGAASLPSRYYMYDGTYDIYYYKYDATEFQVWFVPGYCGINDELDYDALFAGAHYLRVASDPDSVLREHGSIPADYDPATHQRMITIAIENDLSDDEAAQATLLAAMNEFEAFDFVGKVSVVLSAAPWSEDGGFKPTDEQRVYDIDLDRKINSRDVTLLMKHLGDGAVNVFGKGDVNGDGKINSRDLIALMKFVLSQA